MKLRLGKIFLLLLVPVLVFQTTKILGFDGWLAAVLIFFMILVYLADIWRRTQKKKKYFWGKFMRSAHLVDTTKIDPDSIILRGYVVFSETLLFSKIYANSLGLYFMKDISSAYFFSWGEISITRDLVDESSATLSIFDNRDNLTLRIPWSDEFQAKRLSAL